MYVESNFVLEQTLQQEQCEACDEILRLAVSGAISLVIPAFSLAEPHQALALKAKARNRLRNEVENQISELGRSRQYSGVHEESRAFVSALAKSADQEQDGLEHAIEGLIRAAEIVPLDAGILTDGSEAQAAFGMSGQDAIVLAPVLRHLQQVAPGESCFLSRNSRDFDEPGVKERLDQFGCRYFANFDHALQYILARV